ncbi:MAG: DUF1450 domain-containing protein [Sporolactobacillus sp.]
MSDGMGLILIELCDYNQLSEEDLASLEKYPEVAIMSYECLNICGMCSLRPFAMVNGQRIFADSVDACVQKIETKVRQELEEING